MFGLVVMSSFELVLVVMVFLVIETLSLSFRLVSLVFRLVANVVAGHLIVHLFVSIAFETLVITSFAVSSLFVVLLTIILTLEFVAMLIQLYVFTLLVVINDGIL